MILFVHDEIVCETDAGDTERVGALLETELTRPASRPGVTIDALVATAMTAERWSTSRSRAGRRCSTRPRRSRGHMSAELLLDVEAAADLLAVPALWLLTQARRDAVPHVHLGRDIRFDPVELQGWWRARMRGPQAFEAREAPPAS